MTIENYDTLSSAVDALTQQGFTEDFQGLDECIKAVYADREYATNSLKIVKSFRFEGMTNPADATAVFAIEADDGTKGTMVVSYSSEHNQSMELLKKISIE